MRAVWLDNGMHYLEAELLARFGTDPIFFRHVERCCFDGMWYWDLEYPEHEYLSPRFWELFGIDPATKAHLASEWQGIIHDEDLAVARENLEKHLRDPDHRYDQLVRYRHVDGHTVWVRCRGIAIRDEAGLPVRLFGAHTDVTDAILTVDDLERNAVDLRDHATFLETLVETMGSGVVVCDRDRNTIVFNPAAETTLDTRLTRTVPQSWPVGFSMMDPATGRRLRLDEMPMSRALHGDTVTDFLALVRTPKGATKHLSINASPLRDDRGEIAGAVANLRDVTELMQRGAFLQALVDNIGEGICACDSEHRITVFNDAAAAICGFDLRDRSVDRMPERLTMLDIETGEPIADADLPLVRAIRGEIVRGEVYRLRTARDGERIIIVNAGPIRDVRGAYAGAVSGFRDITAERRAQEQQLRAQRLEALGQLTGGVAHDFNNILGTILGSLELLARKVPEAPDTRMLLETALQATRHGADLTRQLLTFARHAPTSAEVHRIGDLCEGLGRLASRTIEASIAWHAELGAPDLSVSCDRTDFETALLNLILNARAAVEGRAAPRITLTQRRFDDANGGTWVEVAVSDNGCGMTAAVRERALEPFFTTRAHAGGTGLGLSAAYGFVKQNLGELLIYSEPGTGTTVRVRLPRHLAEPAGEPSGDGGEPEVERPLKVLIVDDDPALLAVLTASLEELGCRVLSASDGHAALRLMESGAAIDLLITDVVMPGGMSGVELAHRAADRRPELPVVLTSGYAGDKLQWLDVADPVFIQKPCSLSDLRSVLAKVPSHG